MKEPISKLPFNTDGIDIVDAEYNVVAKDIYESDITYILKASNNFPKAIELLKECLGDYSYYNLKNKIEQFINTIENGTTSS